MQITAIVRRQSRARNSLRDHARVAQDRRAVLQRRARGGRHARREADMCFEADHAGGMDHAHHDLLLIRREAREIGLGPDGRKGLPVDRGAIGLDRRAASVPSHQDGGIANDVVAVEPAQDGLVAGRSVAHEIESIAPVATSVIAAAPDGRSPWRSRRREAARPRRMCGASAAASARVSAWASRQRGAPLQAMTRSAGSSASVIRPDAVGIVAHAFAQDHPPRRHPQRMPATGRAD